MSKHDKGVRTLANVTMTSAEGFWYVLPEDGITLRIAALDIYH